VNRNRPRTFGGREAARHAFGALEAAAFVRDAGRGVGVALGAEFGGSLSWLLGAPGASP